MSENTLTLTCPACGKTITIPEGLEDFACMYCGNKMSLSDFASGKEVAPVRLAPIFTEHRDIFAKSFAKNVYDSAFRLYAAECRTTVEQLNDLLLAEPASRSAILTRAAEEFLDDINAVWQADPRWKSRGKRGIMIDEDKMVLAVFTVPMINYLALPMSADIANAIQAEWVKRFPKSPFYVGNFEDISKGFRGKFFGLCFITTAVCEFDGKPDDCRELTVLRSFRDGYLASEPDGAALIDEYYETAPVILKLIDLTSDRARRYAELRDEYILPCVEDAESGRFAECKSRYVRMMRRLEKEYLPRA